MTRLRSDFWIAALRRRAEAAGAFVAVARRGATEAGTIFLVVDRLDGTLDLYGPAPQTEVDAGERLFSRLVAGADRAAVHERLDREARFDSDLWVIDIDDRDGRPFVDVAAEPDDRPEAQPPGADPFSIR